MFSQKFTSRFDKWSFNINEMIIHFMIFYNCIPDALDRPATPYIQQASPLRNVNESLLPALQVSSLALFNQSPAGGFNFGSKVGLLRIIHEIQFVNRSNS